MTGPERLFPAEASCTARLIFPSCMCVRVCACWCVSVCVFALLAFTPLPPFPTPNLGNPSGLKKEIPPLCPGLLFLGVCASCVLQFLHSADALQSVYNARNQAALSQ